MMRWLVPALALVVSACALSYEDTDGFDPAAEAVMLMVIDETHGAQGPQRAEIRLGGTGVRAVFRTQTGSDARAPDRTEAGRTLTYRALAVRPGRYALDLWRFAGTRGAATRADLSHVVTVEAGQVYYLGHFRADGRSFTAAVTDEIDTDLPPLRQKFTFIGDDVVNKAPLLVQTCWPQDIALRAHRTGARPLPAECLPQG